MQGRHSIPCMLWSSLDSSMYEGKHLQNRPSRPSSAILYNNDRSMNSCWYGIVNIIVIATAVAISNVLVIFVRCYMNLRQLAMDS